MPTNHTPNYQLSQWERDVRILMEDFNADNAKIDGALGELAAASAAHGALLPRLGNCAVYAGTHIGTGDGLPVVLTIPGRPMVLMVQDGLAPLAIVALRGWNPPRPSVPISPMSTSWLGGSIPSLGAMALRLLTR